MLWYITIATLLFFGFFSKRPKEYYYVSLIILFIFTAFRDTTLGDYYNLTYKAIFNLSPKLFEFSLKGQQYEAGYLFLCSLSKLISRDFRVFQVIYTLIAMVLLYFVIELTKLSYKDKNLFLFVYFCMRFFINNFIILRQNIADLIIWNLLFMSVGFVLTVALIILSAQFHITSYANFLTLGIIRILKKVKLSKIFIFTLICSVCCLALSDSVINRIVNAVILFAGDRFQSYILSDNHTKIGFNIIYYFIRLIFYILFYFEYEKIDVENKKTIFLISSVAVVLGSVNVGIFSRFMEFFMIGIYIIMTLSYKAFTKRSQNLYLFLLYIGLMIIMVRQLLIYGGGYLLNYSFFF